MWPTYPTTQLVARLTAANLAAYPTISPSQLHLYKNDVVPDANSIVGMFTEADFNGYFPENITMSPVALNDANIPVAQGNLVHFQPTDELAPNTIYGVYITNNAGNLLIAAQRFDTPQPMNNALNVIAGLWRVSEPLSNYGWLSVE